MSTALRALATAPRYAEAYAVEACSQLTDPDLMFPDMAAEDRGLSLANNSPAARAAKAVCAGCPVRDLCLEYAVAHREPWGIWGGMTAKEREALRRRMSRAQARARQRAALVAAAPFLAAADRGSRVHAWAEQLELFEGAE